MPRFLPLAAIVHLLAVWGFTQRLEPVLFVGAGLGVLVWMERRTTMHPLKVFAGMTITSAVMVGVWLLYRRGLGS